MEHHNDFGWIFWLHLAVILAFFASPFLVRWKAIAVVILLFYLQLLIFGGCVLTQKQFGKGASANNSFYHYYLTKLGLKLEKESVNHFIVRYVPGIVLILALIWQVVLGKTPYLYSLFFLSKKPPF